MGTKMEKLREVRKSLDNVLTEIETRIFVEKSNYVELVANNNKKIKTEKLKNYK